MKIFVRHLRIRPNIRSSLRAPPQASPAHYQPHPHVPEGVEAESLTRYKPPSKLSSPTRSALQESRIPASRQQLQQSQYRNRDYDAEEETSSYTPRQRSREYEEEEITSYSPRQHASRARPQSQPRYQSHEENDEVSAYSSRQRSSKSRAYEEDSGDYAHHSRTSKAESYAEIEPTERAPKPPKEPRVREPRLHLSDLIPESFTPYSYRWETLAPTPDELIDADRFFLKYPPKHLWSEAKFKKIDFGDVPEVAFLGRSNVGKSSLLNALLNNKNLAYTSSKPGRTRLMNAFGIADGKLVLLDMPGYGHASREEWGVQIMKYLKSRKQFRRAFLLIDAKHGLKKNDLQLLEQFGQEGISYQIVLSKIDRVKPKDLEKLFKEVRDLMENGIPGANAGLGEILATAGDPAKKGEKKVGLSDLRRAILVASGLEGVQI
ncbi:uncharacterized protein H6S33_010030 [Morchella sextelata]|uniref:uncharacterized protein n=1 Tax=Morchella sextelata TaxID=1174677 RepID=UPI001D047A14|nr:uncharacterized protein H6S33_010030 [Morchella sextelata]KAH0611978.1 hypothetical protein H6S33_010030 [Morchella sextelata]